MTTALDIINEIRDLDEGYTPADVREALEDGAFLSNYSWTQEEVEAAYDLVDNITSWDELKAQITGHGGAREGAGRPALGTKAVGIRLTPEEHAKLKKLGGSDFVRELLKEADDRTLYVFYDEARGWTLEITTVYDFCRRHDIDDYDDWRGKGESLCDVMDFIDKQDALDFIESEVDDQEATNEMSYDIKAY